MDESPETNRYSWARGFAYVYCIFSVELPNENLLVFFFNSYWEALKFDLPVTAIDKIFWDRWIDTHLDSPQDIVERQTAPAILASFSGQVRAGL